MTSLNRKALQPPISAEERRAAVLGAITRAAKMGSPLNTMQLHSRFANQLGRDSIECYVNELVAEGKVIKTGKRPIYLDVPRSASR